MSQVNRLTDVIIQMYNLSFFSHPKANYSYVVADSFVNALWAY